MKNKKQILIGVVALSMALTTGCGKDEEQFDKGLKAFEAGNYESALIYFEEAIELNPDVADYYIYNGMALIKNGDMDKALLEFDKAILDTDNQIVRQNNKKSYRGKGIAYFEMADYKNAVEAFDKALEIKELSEMNRDINYYKSNALEACKEYEEAIKTCDELLKEDKSDPDIFFRSAKCKAGLGKHEDAIKDYDKAIGLDDTNYDYYFGKYDSQIEMGETEEAEKTINKALAIKGSKKDNGFSLARLNYLIGNYEAALPLFEDAYKDGNMQAAYYIGSMYLNEKKYGDAAKYLREYIKSETTLRVIEPYSELILCDINIGEYDEAKQMIEKALKLKHSEETKVVEHNEIVLYEKMQDFKTAYEKCEKYIAKYPDDKGMAEELEFLKTRI